MSVSSRNRSTSIKKSKTTKSPATINDNDDHINHKVIGKGAYGCVHKPSLRCKTKKVKTYKNKISKFMLTDHAEKEMEEYKAIETADPNKLIYLGKPTECIPADDEENNKAIQNCDLDDWTTDTHSLLVMDDGGVNLEDFAKNFEFNKETPENTRKMELFWIEAQRILYGLTVFFENDIVHHDLKAQNIVYNEEYNRINFIDFGLMTSKKEIIEECNMSIYDLAIAHWSFPFELHIMNKRTFNKMANWDRKKKEEYLVDFLQKRIINGGKKGFKYLFYELFGDFSKSEQEAHIKKAFNGYKDFILDDFINYDYTLNKCVETIDIYGVGIAFTKVLSKTSRFIDNSLFRDLSDFVEKLITSHPPSRTEPTYALHQYEEILEKHGLLTKYKKHFVNHILIDKVETKTKIDNIIVDKIKTIDLTMTRKDIANLNSDPNIICPEGKEVNPSTKRCVKMCKDNEIRNNKFRCVKTKKLKLKSQK